jgi:hypothetical protein
MGRYLASKNRVSAGIGTIAVVAVTGMAFTAAVLVGMDPGKPVDMSVTPPTSTPAQTPPTGPEITPRADTLTYTVMSDQWANYGQKTREILCVSWAGGYIIRDGKAVTLTRNQVVVQEMRRASRINPSVIDYLEHGTVAQFLDETCPAFLASNGEVGTAVSIDRNRKG